MTFQTAGQGSLATERAERDVPADEGSMSDRMAAGYSLLGIAPPPGVALPSSSSIAVPAWMRAGRVLPGDTVSTAILPDASALVCDVSAYRPRPDLGWRAEARRVRLYPIIAQVACEAGVPVGLFDALVAQESRYDVTALSPKGAIGLAQLMPGTASALGSGRPGIRSPICAAARGISARTCASSGASILPLPPIMRGRAASGSRAAFPASGKPGAMSRRSSRPGPARLDRSSGGGPPRRSRRSRRSIREGARRR